MQIPQKVGRLKGRSWRGMTALALVVSLFGVALTVNTDEALAVAPDAPTGVEAIAGGAQNIAITWDKSSDFDDIERFEVWRDGHYRGPAIPGSGDLRYQQEGRTYIDTFDICDDGCSYGYKVRAVNDSGEKSAFSDLAEVDNPAVGNTTPVPTITYDLKGNNDMKDFMDYVSVPDMKVWYPKIADHLARGAYTPPSNINVSFELTSGVANASWDTGTIRVNPTWFRANKNDTGGMFIHEMTHIMQAGYRGKNPTTWGTEGMADWTREFFARERMPQVQTQSNFLYQGYSQGSALIAAGNRYNENFARNLNVALNAGTYQGDYYAPDFVRAQTGRSVSQLWAETGGRLMSDYTDVRGRSGLCLDIPGLNTTTGTDIKASQCNEQYQRWAFIYDNNNRREGVLRSEYGGKCLDVDQQNGPVGNGTVVQLWDCNYGIAQKWIIQQDGSMRNPQSNLCLDVNTQNGVTPVNTKVQVWACNGTAQQKWTVPLFSGNLKNKASGDCADVAGFNPASGTKIQSWDCFGNKAQEWSVMPVGASTTNFALRSLGKCLDVSGSGTANGTKIILWDCNNNAAQVWKKGANGSLVNPQSGKCLQATGGSVTPGTQLEINACNGSDAQNWQSPIDIPAVVNPTA